MDDSPRRIPVFMVTIVAAGVVSLLAGPTCGSGEHSSSAGQKRSADMTHDESAAASISSQDAAPQDDSRDSTVQDEHAHTNRLINETSPYLLQHAHNPVDWYAWGDEAIQKARDEDKLIFLSVGYSTCYWCHVMERESFEDEATAKVMNELFVCIKVDREERPDVDDIYMMALQLLTRHGGWPMSVWIEPETLKPVYAGSYFPKEPRQGLPAFTQILESIANAWDQQREQVMQAAEQIAAGVEAELSSVRPVTALDPAMARRGVETLLENHDQVNGGFGTEPKFPQPAYLEFLMQAREWVSSGPLITDEALVERIDETLTRTLDRMATGGMYDQIGGGFHRYSTDEKWLVPHFEKMLYDNGQLASLYAHASELYDDDYYREIVRETLGYTLREMTDPATRAFYSAQDAEVNAHEGQNYLWNEQQVRDTLTNAGKEELVEFALEVYGLAQGTNFQDPHYPLEPRSNVIFLIDRPDVAAEDLELSLEEFEVRIETINKILLAERTTRDQPRTDDKVIVAWNGLMIAGMAEGGRVLNDPSYIEAATDAATYILKNMRSDDGGLLRTYRDGRAKIDAFLEDYANLAAGCIALYRATQDQQWLDAAVELTSQANARFIDPVNGGYFDTREGQQDLFVRSKTTFDGALPSGNSVMLRVLMDLSELTGDEQYLDHAQAALGFFSTMIAQSPTASGNATIAMVQMAMAAPERLPRAATDPGGLIPAEFAGLASLAIDRNRARVSIDDSDVVTITMNIDDDYHINAHEPGHVALFGLLVHITGGEGIVAHADYPAHETYDMAGFENRINIYHGRIQIPVRFEKIGDITGRPQLTIRWQPCTDTSCLEPQEYVFDLEFDVE